MASLSEVHQRLAAKRNDLDIVIAKINRAQVPLLLQVVTLCASGRAFHAAPRVHPYTTTVVPSRALRCRAILGLAMSCRGSAMWFGLSKRLTDFSGVSGLW